MPKADSAVTDVLYIVPAKPSNVGSTCTSKPVIVGLCQAFMLCLLAPILVSVSCLCSTLQPRVFWAAAAALAVLQVKVSACVGSLAIYVACSSSDISTTRCQALFCLVHVSLHGLPFAPCCCGVKVKSSGTTKAGILLACTPICCRPSGVPTAAVIYVVSSVFSV